MDIRRKPLTRSTVPEKLNSNAESGCKTRDPDNQEGSISSSTSGTRRRSPLWPGYFPRYADPSVQVALVALVSFLCPGMWNALNGLGGGGLVDAEPANNANVALYSTFAVVGFFAGIATNKIGVRATLSLGGFGYTLYSSSLLCYKHTKKAGFLIFAGLQLGLCAGLFWTAQGMVMLSYPTEKSKGKYIAWSWMIYNMGAVIGSAVSATTSVIKSFSLILSIATKDCACTEHAFRGQQYWRRHVLHHHITFAPRDCLIPATLRGESRQEI